MALLFAPAPSYECALKFLPRNAGARRLGLERPGQKNIQWQFSLGASWVGLFASRLLNSSSENGCGCWADRTRVLRSPLGCVIEICAMMINVFILNADHILMLIIGSLRDADNLSEPLVHHKSGH